MLKYHLNNMKKIYLLLLIVAFSCQSAGENEIKILKDEVMAVHDEVMPKMGELRRTRKSLMLQADSLLQIDSLRSAELSTLAAEIESANEGMMQWMRAFEPDFEGTDEEIKTYFEAQKESIQQVKEAMENSLLNGKKAISPE